MPAEMQLSEDSIEYFITNTEETVEFLEEEESAGKKLRTLIREYMDGLAPQAKGIRKVGHFLLRNKMGNYINERGRFRSVS